MKFRKKPVVVEALQLTWGNWNQICDFVPKPLFEKGVWIYENGDYGDEPRNMAVDRIGLLIRTDAGTMLAEQGDWIIRGTKGEFYPCKPDIFAEIYESVE